MRPNVSTARFAKCLVQPVDADEGQAVGVHEILHPADVELVREELAAFGGVDAVETAVPRRRAGDAHMNFGRSGVAHHLDNLQARRSAHDTVVNEDDAFACNQRAVGVVFEFDAEVANLIAGLDERAADIVRADDAEFERNA